MRPKSENGDGDHPSYVISPVVARQRVRTNVPDFVQFQNGKDTVRNQFPMPSTILRNQEEKLSVTSYEPTRINVDVVRAVNVDPLRRPSFHVPGLHKGPPDSNHHLKLTASRAMIPKKRKSPGDHCPTSQSSLHSHSGQWEPASKMAKVENKQMTSYAYRDSEPSSSNNNFNQPPGSCLQWAPNKTVTVRKAERVSSVTSSVGGPVIINRMMPPKPAVTDEDRNFQPNILRRCLQPVWDRLFNSDASIPFREPVDPVQLNIPDYLDIVKQPMDLSTIANKLNYGTYANPWEFCDDIWLMFKNAWLYNRKTSKVHREATKLSELFMEEMDPVMRNMGYCCSRNLSFTPHAIFCYGSSMCTIARDQSYMIHKSPQPQFGISESDYMYCLKCFEDLPSSNTIPKEKFVEMKNNVIHDESFEKCKSCHKKWHRICALFDKSMIPGGFLCDSCRSRKCYPRPNNTSTAKMLPHNKLSLFLETRVNNFITSQSSRSAEKNQVIVRTLFVEDKNLEVKPLMKEKFSPQGFPERFPYRAKAVFAFEVIDGMEVCFFGMHVQEYGSNVPNPNQRRVYISYLDSVHYFQPRELRTEVYHEILLGYLDYVRGLGYSMAHIWACPPAEGDDYIFHCHPPEQKIPKPKRLQEWYKTMLDKGIRECSISDYKDIYQQAKDDGLMSPVQLPYFEGDYWPNVIEDCLRETNEDLKRKRLEHEGDGEQFVHYSQQGNKSYRRSMKGSKKNGLAQRNKHTTVTGDPLTDKLYSMLEKQRDVFFTIRLRCQPSSETREIFDPDPVMPCDLMDGRETFLTRARDEHWEFSSLRRAKYSTMVFCHALHDPENRVALSCNKCSGKALNHCTVCEDFDLCDICYKVENHPHKMDTIQSSFKRNKKEECVASIIHACQCHDATCNEGSCRKMKKVIHHTKSCKLRNNCSVCKQLLSLCFYHSKGCSKDRCPVPFCVSFRERFLEQQRYAVYRADMMMRRRMGALGIDENRMTR